MVDKIHPNTTHGMSGIREYRIWRGMISRCTLPCAAHYARYGGRGISVCARWRRFENFFSDMGPAPTQKHSVDRIDSEKNYSPENCRWADSKTQARNKSDNKLFMFNGITKIQNDWCDHFKIDRHVFLMRIRAGMSPYEAFTKVTYNKMQRLTITAFGKTQTVHEWAKETGFDLRSLKYRAEKGWPGELAVTSKPNGKRVPWKKLVANE